MTLDKDFLLNANIQESSLYLGVQGCGVNGGNATHVQLTVAWDECATVLVQVSFFCFCTFVHKFLELLDDI